MSPILSIKNLAGFLFNFLSDASGLEQQLFKTKKNNREKKGEIPPMAHCLNVFIV